ncbi:MAG: hypothetical protein KF718_29140 [Polyangiaceae bacterium]|nr:hypothetical protein [Polyangiaceae bacterium]
MSDAPGFVRRRLIDGIAAASEGLFPPNEFGAPDFRDTEMVTRTLAYLDELPPTQRRLVSLLFIAVEWLAPLLLLVPRRFSRLSHQERAAAVRSWRKSKLFLLRLLGDALKASTTMMYMSHPKVIAYIGEHRACQHPQDPLDYPVRPDALPRVTEQP